MNNKFQEAITPNEKHPSEVSMEFKSENPILSETEAEDLIDSAEVIEDVEEDEQDRLFDDEMSYRTVNLSRASYIDEETRRVRIGVSSESEVERSFGLEVLSHRTEDIDMSFIKSGTAPLLNNHNMNEQIGVIEEFRLDEAAKRTVAVVRFGRSALAQEVFQDVVDGIKQNISVGYRINKLEQSNNDKIGDHYRASWTPYEASLVSIPADTDTAKVGVGRPKSNKLPNTKVKIMENEKQEINLDEVRSQSADEARKEFAKNSKEILDLAAKHNKRDLGNQAIQDQLSVDDFRGQLLDQISNDVPLETPNEIGLTPKETQRFSVVKAIRALANPTDRRSQEDAAFEFECSNAAAAAEGKTSQGIMLPSDVLRNWSRDMNSSDDSTLIAPDYRGGDFIDVLRNASTVMQAGATVLNGLKGNVTVPKKTAASSAGWIATEGAAASESEMTTGSVTMAPKVVGAFTDATRLLLGQSSLSIENLIRDDLAKGIAQAIDVGGLMGSGSSGQPTGIRNTSGINTSTFAAANPTWAEIVGLESDIAADNALLGNLRYICTPSEYGTMKVTSKDSGSGQFLVSPDGRVNGYDVIRSQAVTSGDFYFGNFADLLIGFFSGLDLTVDPYSLSTTGSVRIVALQNMDIAVRHPESFILANDG